MDNLTHSLAGIAVAEVIVQLRIRKKKNPLRAPLYLISVLANNFPDFDFIYANFLSGELGYLLHHRGHTHTFLLGLFQSVFIFLSFYLFFRWKNWKYDRRDYLDLCILAGLGIPIHIFLDLLNSYGVHPFWPWNNQWYSLDAVFILEPWFWLTICAAMFFQSVEKKRKIFYAVLFLSTLVLIEIIPIIPAFSKFFYIVCGTFFIFLASKVKNGLQRIVLAIFLCLSLPIGLVFLSRMTKHNIQTQFEKKYSSEKMIEDIVRSPSPANPLCWNFFVIASDSKLQTYEVETGRWNWLGAFSNACSKAQALEPNAELSPLPSNHNNEYITWGDAWVQSWGVLNKIDQDNCYFSAFLRFSRVPYWKEVGNTLYFGDLRFDRNKEKGFAEFFIESEKKCPEWIPPWEKPRKHILSIAN